MKCNEEALSAYIDNELDAEAHAEIEEHLTECSECTKTLESLKHTQTRLRENCEDTDLHTTVMQRVRRAEEVLGKNQRRRIPFGLVGAAAAIVLLALATYAYVVTNNRPIEIVKIGTPPPPLQPPTETAHDVEPIVEAPPEPAPPEIVEAVAPMVEEAPATPAPPNGYWNAVLTMHQADQEEPEITNTSATISNLNGDITLAVDGALDFHGTLNGHDAIFEKELQEGIRYALRGTFNPAYTVFEGTGSFTYDKNPEQNIQFQIYATQLTEEEEKPFKLAALFEQRVEEVEQLADAVRDFAEAHDNAYPSTVGQLPAKIRGLLDESSEKEISLLGGSRMLYSIGEHALWKEYKTEYPLPDRLMMYESELAVVREKGRSQKIMRVTYDEPKMVFAMDAFGAVHTEEFDRSGLPQRVASGAQAEAERSSCANNMKQLGIVVKMFESEYDGYSPPSMEFAWPEYLTDRNILTCPADLSGEDSYEYLFPATHLEEFLPIAALELGRITEEQFNDPDRASSGIGLSDLPLLVERNGHIAERNGEQFVGFNVLFADGHLTFYTQERLDEAVGPYYALR